MEVSVQGTRFGSDPSSASVLFNGLPAPVLGWSDQSVTVTVPEELEDYGGGTVSVTVIAGSLQSNAVEFTLTDPLMITPKLLTLVPGQSWVLQVLDSDGAELTGVDWNVPDTAVLEVLQGDSATRWNVTAKAAGTSKVIASLGDRRGTAKVDSVLLPEGEQLATGTVIWAAPPLKGGRSWNVVRSNGAVDAPEYFVEEYEPGSASRIRAFTATGQQAWVWPLADSTSDAWPAIAGASNDGGVFAFSINYGLGEISLVKIDRAGHESWRHRADGDEQFAVHPDGTVFIVDSDSVVALDTAGNQRFTVPLPASTESLLNLGKMDYQDAQGNTHWADVCKPGEAQTSSDTGFAGSFTIDENGIVYLPVEVTTNVLDAMPCQFKYKNNVTPPAPEDFFVDQHGDETATYQYSVAIQLLRMNSTSSLGSTTLDSRSASGTDWNTQVDDLVLGSGGVIPSGNSGALVTVYHRQASHWWGGGSTAGYAFAYNTSAGTSYQLPIRNISNLFLDANGTAYADYYWGNTIAAFDAVSGAPKFTYTNPSGYLSLSAILEDGLLAHGNQRSYYGATVKLNSAGAPVPFTPPEEGGDPNESLPMMSAAMYLHESGNHVGGVAGQLVGKVKGSKAYQHLSRFFCRVRGCNEQQQNRKPQNDCPRMEQQEVRARLATALAGLQNFLADPSNCPLCESLVFKSSVQGFNGITRKDFVRYLSTPPQFCDGTKSEAPESWLYPNPWWEGTFWDYTLAEVFSEAARLGSPITATTATNEKFGKNAPLWTFFDPTRIGSDDQENQAMIFHEALHGYTGKGDAFLCLNLGISPNRPEDSGPPYCSSGATIKTTRWLRNLMYP
jgi:hypothetical protein